VKKNGGEDGRVKKKKMKKSRQGTAADIKESAPKE
jgi:hypothetical protein